MEGTGPTAEVCWGKDVGEVNSKSNSSPSRHTQCFLLKSSRAVHFSTFSVLQLTIPWTLQPAKVTADGTWPLKPCMPSKMCVHVVVKLSV